MNCIDCGEPTNGVRCRKHANERKALDWAMRTAEQDIELLQLHDGERVSISRLAVRYGRTRARIWQRLRDARRRQTLMVHGYYEPGPKKKRKVRT
jgi:hypothetical protein